MEPLGRMILDWLAAAGPLTSVALANRLSVNVTDVQEALLRNDQVFGPPTGGEEEWSLLSPADLAEKLGMRRAMRPWQVEAFQRWAASGKSGVIEAVTGAGKTEAGLAAIADARRRGVPALILVPDEGLVDQWREAVETAFPGVRVGLPDRSRALTAPEQIVVCTSEGLGKKRLSAFRDRGLLVADEIQRFAVSDLADVVFPRTEITERLGLTASYEWASVQVERTLRPYFGEMIQGCGYRRAVDEDILAKPLVVTVGVSFSGKERDEYDALSKRIDRAEQKLRETGVDLSEGIYESARAIDSGSLAGEIKYLAHEYLEAVDGRRWVMSECTSKVGAVELLAAGLHDVRRTTVFTVSDNMSLGVVRAAKGAGLRANAILENDEPGPVLRGFSSGSIDLVATSRLLNEGVAVPTSQIGIATAAARSRAQMLQRMGRVIHPVDWADRTAFVVVYVNSTIEDPFVGSRGETHLDELFAVAAERHDVGPAEAAALLAEWTGRVADREDADKNEDTEPAGPPQSIEDDWNPEDAILDIVDEYEGILTWRELREVLPDLVVEEALMQGVGGLSWMAVGESLVGIGGRRSAGVEDRIRTLDMLAQLFVSYPHEISTDWLNTVIASALPDGRVMSSERIKQLWDVIIAENTGQSVVAVTPDPGEDVSESDVLVASGETDRVKPETRTPVKSFVGAADNRVVRAVVDRIEAMGGRVDADPSGSTSTVLVTAPDGRTSLITIRGGAWGHWRVPKADRTIADGASERDAVVLVADEPGSQSFYIIPVGPYSARIRSVMGAHPTLYRPRDNAPIDIETWVIKDGLERWGLIGLAPTASSQPGPSTQSAEGPRSVETVRPEDPAVVERVPRPLDLVWSQEGELRVVLDYDGTHTVGFFNPDTAKLRIDSAPGAKVLSGKTFRNPAVAAATLKSKVKHRTVFSVGYDDWLVDENTRQTLADYLG